LISNHGTISLLGIFKSATDLHMGAPESESKFVVCRCQTCPGKIEFDASRAGEAATCPHCGCETILFFTPTVTPPARTPDERNAEIEYVLSSVSSSPMEPVWLGTEASIVVIRLNSGAVLQIKAVRLFDAAKLNFLSAQKTHAAELFEGVKSPYRAFGDIGWVLLASKVTGMLEKKLSREAAEDGIELIQKIAELERQLRLDIKFFHVGQIQEIENPIPNLWTVLMSGLRFVHSEEDFITVKDTEGIVKKIRWNCVESYEYQANK